MPDTHPALDLDCLHSSSHYFTHEKVNPPSGFKKPNSTMNKQNSTVHSFFLCKVLFGFWACYSFSQIPLNSPKVLIQGTKKQLICSERLSLTLYCKVEVAWGSCSSLDVLPVCTIHLLQHLLSLGWSSKGVQAEILKHGLMFKEHRE